jgi:hypothetical protein
MQMRQTTSAPGRLQDGRALVQLRLQADLAQKVKAAAKAEGLPVSAWVRRLCIYALRDAAN